MKNIDKIPYELQIKEYEMIIEKLQRKNIELTNKAVILHKLCENLENYIEEHNLTHKHIQKNNSSGNLINKLEDFDKITYLKIPSAVYVITQEDNITEEE